MRMHCMPRRSKFEQNDFAVAHFGFKVSWQCVRTKDHKRVVLSSPVKVVNQECQRLFSGVFQHFQAICTTDMFVPSCWKESPSVLNV